jgi:hypothetical protein
MLPGALLLLGQLDSPNIGWILTPSVGDLLRDTSSVFGYPSMYRWQPFTNISALLVSLLGLSFGLRTPSVIVAGLVAILTPIAFFAASQLRPVLTTQTIFLPSFAIPFLAGYACAAVKPRLWGLALVPLIALPSIISTKNLIFARGDNLYKQSVVAICDVLHSGDAAAGPDGIIYYKRKSKNCASFYKLALGYSATAQVTFGAKSIDLSGLRDLVDDEHYIYLVVLDSHSYIAGKVQSINEYVLNQLGLASLVPFARFGEVYVYKIKGGVLRAMVR